MNRDLVAYSLSNTFAKKLSKSVDGHQNYSMPSQCRFFETHCISTTRRSAIAEGPRDASCQLKSCQLPRNSAETTCMTSPEKIEVMKLEGYCHGVSTGQLTLTMPL